MSARMTCRGNDVHLGINSQLNVKAFLCEFERELRTEVEKVHQRLDHIEASAQRKSDAMHNTVTSDTIKAPEGPMTRARIKRFKDQ